MANQDRSTKKWYHYKVVECETIDGDTVHATLDLGFGVKFTDRFRLLGIDAPEKRPLATRQEAIKSENRLKELIATGFESGTLTIATSTNNSKGKFGRFLCEIWCEDFDQSFNAILLQEGFAVEFMVRNR